MSAEHFQQLVFAYLDGRASAQQFAALQEQLSRSAERRREYWSLVNTYYAIGASFEEASAYWDSQEGSFVQGLAELLEHERRVGQTLALRELPEDQWPDAQERSAERMSRSEATAAADRRPQKVLEVGPLRVVRRPAADSGRVKLRHLRYAAWAALMVLTVGVAAVLMQHPGDLGPAHVATVTDAVSAEWREAEQGPLRTIRTGQGLVNGPLHLSEGFAELTMAGRTSLVLEGPVTLELLSDEAIALQRGRLVGIAGEGAETFTVHTPSSRVVDVGTEFGVEVTDQGTTDVAVFEGAVDFAGEHEAWADQPQRIAAGHRSQADTEGVLLERAEALAGTSRQFIRRMPLSEYEARVFAARPLAYWRFAEVEDGRVPNVLARAYAAEVMGDVGFGQGLLGAVELGRDAEVPSYLQVDAVQELSGARAYSIEMWIEPRAVEHSHITLLRLLGSGGMESPAAYVAGLVGGEGPASGFHRLRGRFMHGESDLYVQDAYEPGRRTHLVHVKTERELRFYVDGELAASTRDTTGLPEGLGGLLIGHFPAVDQQQYRGWIDALAVYGHALDEQQVREHFEAGSESHEQRDPGNDERLAGGVAGGLQGTGP